MSHDDLNPIGEMFLYITYNEIGNEIQRAGMSEGANKAGCWRKITKFPRPDPRLAKLLYEKGPGDECLLGKSTLSSALNNTVSRTNFPSTEPAGTGPLIGPPGLLSLGSRTGWTKLQEGNSVQQT